MPQKEVSPGRYKSSWQWAHTAEGRCNRSKGRLWPAQRNGEEVVHGTPSLQIDHYLEDRRCDLMGIDIAHSKSSDDG
jgi:hypothetical protein